MISGQSAGGSGGGGGENLQQEKAAASGLAALFLGGVGVGVALVHSRSAGRFGVPVVREYCKAIFLSPVPPDLALQWNGYKLTPASQRAWFNGFRV